MGTNLDDADGRSVHLDRVQRLVAAVRRVNGNIARVRVAAVNRETQARSASGTFSEANLHSETALGGFA